MKLRINWELKNTIVVFIVLLISMQLEVYRLLLFAAIMIVMGFSNFIKTSHKRSRKMITLQVLCGVGVFLLLLFMTIQIFVLKLNFRESILDIGVLTCVYIGIICGAISIKPYISLESYLRGILLFLYIFSTYYIIDIIINGLPEGRDSALGNVSSNFCSAVLYLNFPIILYYLFSNNKNKYIKNKKKNLRKACYAALLLSLIVIVSSGSRAAIAVVALMFAQMVLYKENKFKTKLKYFFVILIGLIILVMVSINNQSINKLMTRALGAFDGINSLTKNSRILVWNSGFEQFGNGNRIFGLGTNIVEKFDRAAHNLFFEVLLCSGYAGLTLFIIINTIILCFIWKKQKYEQRFFTFMLLISTGIVAFVHPFFSTSYTCGLIFWMSLFMLTNDSGNKIL